VAPIGASRDRSVADIRTGAKRTPKEPGLSAEAFREGGGYAQKKNQLHKPPLKKAPQFLGALRLLSLGNMKLS